LVALVYPLGLAPVRLSESVYLCGLGRPQAVPVYPSVRAVDRHSASQRGYRQCQNRQDD